LTNAQIETNTKEKRVKLPVFKRLAKYLFRYKFAVITAFVLIISADLLALAGPYISGKAIGAIEKLSGSEMIEKVLFYCGLMVAFYLTSALLSYVLSVIMIRLSQRITYTMRKEVFNKLMTLPISYFDTHQTGEIISHISYDIDTVNASLSTDILQVATSVVTVVGSLVMMIAISPVLVLIFLFTVPMSIFFARYRSTKVRPLFRLRSAKLGELNGYTEEMLSGQKTIKAYNKEKEIISRFDERNKAAVDAYYEADYHASTVGPSVNFINNFSISLIIILGGILYMLTNTGRVAETSMFAISLAGLSSFVQYSRKFSGPINEFANILSEIQSAASAAERVFKLLDEAPEKPDVENATELRDATGKVDLEHVKFGYVPEKTIIHNLNLKVKPKSTVAIVGPTGAGKTTIINLLMRFYDIDDGSIKVDDLDIRDLTRDSLRKSYTMVLQDTWLFYGTIFENISYGKEDATMEEVVAAAKAAKIHSFIESLPDGYNTVLSDDGINISKGQKQLITIARAMLPKSPMLILDEATSNVDSRTELQIQAAMSNLMENRTCFVIAHRLSTIQNADVILVLKDGDVIEQGTHEELLQKKGFYSRLYNAQFD